MRGSIFVSRLLSDAQRADAAYDQDAGTTAASLLAQAYQVAASALRKLGEHQLGWLAADRAIRAVERTGDLCWHGVATFRVGNALLAMGRADAALRVQLGAVNRLSPDTSADDTEARMSVYGIVVLQAAMAAARNNGTYLQTRYKRLAARRGPMRALVATEHAMIISIWHMLTTGETYNDLGSDFYNRNNPTQARRRAIAQLQHLGYDVTLTHAT